MLPWVQDAPEILNMMLMYIPKYVAYTMVGGAAGGHPPGVRPEDGM